MLYTGTGDKGRTGLFGTEERLSKTAPVIEALGVLDELNSLLGVCRAECPGEIAGFLQQLQHDLFIIQAEVAGAPKEIPEWKIKGLEDRIGEIESQLPPIKTFFVPGATRAGAFLDLARTVARRAERRVIAHKENGGLVSHSALQYVNRLSSVLYALARQVNHTSGITETPPSYQ